MASSIAPALPDCEADVLAVLLSENAEGMGLSADVSYMIGDLAYEAECVALCVLVETQHGIVSIIEDRHSRTWMCLERKTHAVAAAIRVDGSGTREYLMDIGSRFLSGTI